MNFQTAIETCFKKYTTFSGRAQRSEYWYFYLFTLIGGLVTYHINTGVYAVFYLLVLLPSLAAGVRRLHDTNRSGWWLLILFIPFAFFVILYWFAKKGTVGPNSYGEDPLEVEHQASPKIL